MNLLRDLCHGVGKHPWKTAQHIFTSFSVLFTFVKIITQFFPSIKIEGTAPLMAGVAVSVAWGLHRVWKPSSTSFDISNCNTTIEVRFGDLFAYEGLRIIAVSEFFDSEIGKPVSDKSVHGIFLKRCFGGHPESFDAQIDKELEKVQFRDIPDKIGGKTRCYPIGTTALVTVNSDKYIIFAFTQTDPATCKVHADVKVMWDALHSLWDRARIESGGHSVNLPLVGSGLSGLGLPTRDLLNLLILSAITETKARQITDRIRIVLHQSKFEDVDLRDIKKHWKE